jgi:hypothetical protein
VPPELLPIPLGAAPGVPADEETRKVDGLVNAVDGMEGAAVPDPVDNCANPTDGGVLRKTEYTFFYKCQASN